MEMAEQIPKISSKTNKDLNRRNLWTRKETNALLRIFKEHNIVNLLMRKPNSPVRIFTMVEKQMIFNGFTKKSTLQIMRKWKKLKSTYSVKYRPKAGFNNGVKIPYFKEIHELITGQTMANELQTDKSSDGADDFFVLDGNSRDALPATVSAAQLKYGADEKRNLWNHDETIAMLTVFREFNVAQSLKCLRKGNMEVYEVVARKMAERGYTKKNSTQIRIKWKRLKSSYFKCKRGIPQDSVRSEDIMQLLETIIESNDSNSDQCITDHLTNVTATDQVFQPGFQFETIQVNVVPATDTTAHHIITTHAPELMPNQEYDQSHIYTQSDKLRAAIPSGIVDSNEVTIETASYDSANNLYDNSQMHLHEEPKQFTPESAEPIPDYTAISPIYKLQQSRELQDDYFRQQRELTAYKYELKAEMQKKIVDYFLDGTRKLIKEIKSDIFNGIKDLIEQTK